METIRGIQLPDLKYTQFNMPSNLNNIKYYSNLTSYIPPMKILFGKEDNSIIFENNYIIRNIDISKNCMLDILYNNTEKRIKAHMKVTHIYDPIHYLKNNLEENIEKKNDPWNQAYIETVASYIFGKLKNENIYILFEFK